MKKFKGLGTYEGMKHDAKVPKPPPPEIVLADKHGRVTSGKKLHEKMKLDNLFRDLRKDAK